LYAFFCGRLL